MRAISRTNPERRSHVALLLAFAILPGLSVNLRAQQSPSRDLFASATSVAASLPDAPVPQSGVLPQGQVPSPAAAQTANSAPEADVAAGLIQGVVTSRDGVPYQGVQVTLTRSRATPSSPVSIPDVRTETSDSNGRFQFRAVPPGPFQLTVASDGFATQTRTGTLNPGGSYEAPPFVLLMVTARTEVQVTASRIEIAQAQLTQEEQQRVLGVIPNFYVVYAPNAMPLTTKQKFHLAWRYSIDPVSFLSAAAFAGIEQDDDDFQGYGQGAEGYAKRFGANYADTFIGSMLGSALLPSIFKQDPRYFYKGTGSKTSRALYAIESSFICRGDNGRREFNYSGILGGLAAAGISNLYYPDKDREGAELTFQNTLIGIATGAAQNLFQEFVVRKLTPKLPDYGSSKP
jgi:hypothetical protein